MSFLNRVLEPPRYGFERDGQLVVPTKKEMFSEFFHRMNIFRSKKNWIQFWGWGSTFILMIPLAIFFVKYFSISLFVWAFVYSMILLGTHGTIYYHRYSTHRAYTFAHPFWRFITKNLVIKIIPEEAYVISHHVHHALSEEPGDPYNVNGGFWYCFLADVIHQPIAKDLNPKEYQRVAQMVNHTGIYINTYEQYQKWGSICHPLPMIGTFALNWSFWYGVFYLIGGHALAMCSFGAAGFWGFGVRTFNFAGHGAGEDKRRDGVDFNRKDKSINQAWPGLVTGEWHNNHHLFPNGARAGFLKTQLDGAWHYIQFLHWIGGVSHYRDFTEEYFKHHYNPYMEKQRALKASAVGHGEQVLN